MSARPRPRRPSSRSPRSTPMHGFRCFPRAPAFRRRRLHQVQPRHPPPLPHGSNEPQGRSPLFATSPSRVAAIRSNWNRPGTTAQPALRLGSAKAHRLGTFTRPGPRRPDRSVLAIGRTDPRSSFVKPLRLVSVRWTHDISPATADIKHRADTQNGLAAKRPYAHRSVVSPEAPLTGNLVAPSRTHLER